MRTWEFRSARRVALRIPSVRVEYMELPFATEKEALRFGLDWFVEDESLVRLTVRDGAGRSDGLDLRRKA